MSRKQKESSFSTRHRRLSCRVWKKHRSTLWVITFALAALLSIAKYTHTSRVNKQSGIESHQADVGLASDSPLCNRIHLSTSYLKTVYLFCDPSDWICRGETLRNLAKSMTKNGHLAIFDPACIQHDVQPRIFFVGSIGSALSVQRNNDLFEKSSSRILLQFEPTTLAKSIHFQVATSDSQHTNTIAREYHFDLVISGVRRFETDDLNVVYWPYALFSTFQLHGQNVRNLFRSTCVHNCSTVPELFGAYATSHCRAIHRTDFYNFVSREYKPLQYLNAKCGEFDASASFGKMHDRGDELKFMSSVATRYGQYKFAVVFESADMPGYITEKLLLAKLGGSIPVYFGSLFVSEIFDPASFVDCTPAVGEKTHAAFRRCLEEMIQLDNDDRLWLRKRAIPLMKRNQVLDDVYSPLAAIIHSVSRSNTQHLCLVLESATWMFPPAFQTRACRTETRNKA